MEMPEPTLDRWAVVPARDSAQLADHAPGGVELTADTYMEVEITDMEGEGESAEMVDDKGGEDDQQNRHEDPKQPPEEARHTASNAHGGQLPINSQGMPAIERTAT
jgi:hypothetical protein